MASDFLAVWKFSCCLFPKNAGYYTYKVIMPRLSWNKTNVTMRADFRKAVLMSH